MACFLDFTANLASQADSCSRKVHETIKLKHHALKSANLSQFNDDTLKQEGADDDSGVCDVFRFTIYLQLSQLINLVSSRFNACFVG